MRASLPSNPFPLSPSILQLFQKFCPMAEDFNLLNLPIILECVEEQSGSLRQLFYCYFNQDAGQGNKASE